MRSAFSRFFGSSDQTPTKNHESVVQLPMDKIQPNRYQPRTIFDSGKLAELAQTIESHGVIQPIVVREVEDGIFEIIAGERRYRAMQSLNWTEAPAIIREMSERETASIALIENLQREELTAIEEAHAYQALLEMHELTQGALAEKLGKGQSTIANKLRLLKLPQEIQDAILNRQISERHARALIPLKDEAQRLLLFNETLEKDYNVRQLEQRIEQLTEADKKPKKKRVRRIVNKDVRIALNTIRESVSVIHDNGIAIDTQEEENDDYFQVTVRIAKKKSK
ncbi:chromosome partitioning protein ParB [Kurthia sp. 3B1D]|uniref:Chromosome partitioning protein ParB n=2 Tax=Kurthia TaxID=1649 RepID=A0A433RW54_9BACL|nr:nucleoid occlusion protein [Kurthia sp. 3B1D]RUS57504.1 chromosome partitioning protein ParB [Kurthia sp. 3B1D]